MRKLVEPGWITTTVAPIAGLVRETRSTSSSTSGVPARIMSSSASSPFLRLEELPPPPPAVRLDAPDSFGTFGAFGSLGSLGSLAALPLATLPLDASGAASLIARLFHVGGWEPRFTIRKKRAAHIGTNFNYNVQVLRVQLYVLCICLVFSVDSHLHC